MSDIVDDGANTSSKMSDITISDTVDDGATTTSTMSSGNMSLLRNMSLSLRCHPTRTS